ncbi:hypothetical protein UY3_15093 [Chelonia mydas]|uniref:Uncharacterized protein n=1 Tax=Chelonia mydas TaxID=8469 RepID=M7AXP0_CHEMY|nr:hypothetical protein UY3_15093 [Chelonia mydas]
MVVLSGIALRSSAEWLVPFNWRQGSVLLDQCRVPVPLSQSQRQCRAIHTRDSRLGAGDGEHCLDGTGEPHLEAVVGEWYHEGGVMERCYGGRCRVGKGDHLIMTGLPLDGAVRHRRYSHNEHTPVMAAGTADFSAGE